MDTMTCRSCSIDWEPTHTGNAWQSHTEIRDGVLKLARQVFLAPFSDAFSMGMVCDKNLNLKAALLKPCIASTHRIEALPRPSHLQIASTFAKRRGENSSFSPGSPRPIPSFPAKGPGNSDWARRTDNWIFMRELADLAPPGAFKDNLRCHRRCADPLSQLY